MRVSYEMTFRDALFYSTSEPGGLEDHVSSSVYPIELFIFSDSYRINRRTLLTGPILQYEGGSIL